ncbi:MAG: hypothetical protein JJ868_15700 [Shimia sp.]|uniref:hypothetical protein n=1 Tax=Shimia sp. TaxID=1954381 RepID=UPI0019F272A6|nr:hypothetical protein [Shimia sp.]MBE1292494.1 hypothetical protein [Paracoccaceae bacterium]MBO6898818.1 hypothetical protein [Shimia sp.]
MKSFLTFIATLLSAQSSLALSCEFPGIIDEYQSAKSSEFNYFVVSGKVTYPQSDIWLDEDEHGFPPPLTQIAAQIDGVSLGANRNETVFQYPLTVELECIATWCGHIPWSGAMEGLFFIREEGEEFFLSIGPCGGGPFSNSEENRKTLQRCLNGGKCRSED